MAKSWIVMDLDGTICDCSHRVHWAQAKQWDEFHAGIPEDKPNEDVMCFLDAMSDSCNFNMIVCTGRDERHRAATQRWFTQEGIDKYFEALLMRPDGDRSSDHELKLKLVDQYFGSREEALNQVLLVLDDRDKVVEAWRDAGFRCWQVAVGNY